MSKRPAILFAVLAALTLVAPAQSPSTLSPFVKKGSARGTIRICGDTQGGLLNLLENAFVEIYPNVALENRPAPSQEAVPAMVLGLADLGIGGAPTEPYADRRMCAAESRLRAYVSCPTAEPGKCPMAGATGPIYLPRGCINHRARRALGLCPCAPRRQPRKCVARPSAS